MTQRRLYLVTEDHLAKLLRRAVGRDDQVVVVPKPIRDLEGFPGVRISDDAIIPRYAVSEPARGSVDCLVSLANRTQRLTLVQEPDQIEDHAAWQVAQATGQPVDLLILPYCNPERLRALLADVRTMDPGKAEAQRGRILHERCLCWMASGLLQDAIPGLGQIRLSRLQMEALLRLSTGPGARQEDRQPKPTCDFEWRPNAPRAKGTVTWMRDPLNEASALDLRLRKSYWRITDVRVDDHELPPPPLMTWLDCLAVAHQTLGYHPRVTQRYLERLHAGGWISWWGTDETGHDRQLAEAGREYLARIWHRSYWADPMRPIQETGGWGIHPTAPDPHGRSCEAEHRPLLEIIVRRFLASLMSVAIVRRTTATMEAFERHGDPPWASASIVGHLAVQSGWRFALRPGDLPPWGCLGLMGEDRLLPRLEEGGWLTCVATGVTSPRSTGKPPSSYLRLMMDLTNQGMGRPQSRIPAVESMIQRRWITEDSTGELGLSEDGSRIADVLAEAYGQDFLAPGYPQRLSERWDLVEHQQRDGQAVLLALVQGSLQATRRHATAMAGMPASSPAEA